ncbi:MAG: MFS transporter [Pseudomonadota bacterium]
MISVLYMVANIDRFVVNLMIESIKRDFGASDIEVSLLVGFTFSLFYVICGFWIARLADRRNRRNLLTLGALLWSVFTALAGAAQSFTQLFIARIGVGVGEGAVVPCGQSMIADEVPPESLGRAISVFSIGSLLGALLAFILGGALLGWATENWPNGLSLPVVGDIYSWQLVFFLLGLPGIVIALLFFATVKEPGRRNVATGEVMTMREVLAFMAAHKRVYVAIIAGVTTVQIGAASATTWMPALLERSFALTPERAGILIAAALVLPGIASALIGGWLADRMRQRGIDDAYLRLAFFSCMIGFLPFGLASIMPTVNGLVAMAALGTLASFMTQTLSMTALQAVSPGTMRATAAAVMSILIALIGYGVGPLIVALITDIIFQDESMLGYSLAIVVTTSFFVAGLFYHQGRADLSAMLADADTRESASRSDALQPMAHAGEPG